MKVNALSKKDLVIAAAIASLVGSVNITSNVAFANDHEAKTEGHDGDHKDDHAKKDDHGKKDAKKAKKAKNGCSGKSGCGDKKGHE